MSKRMKKAGRPVGTTKARRPISKDEYAVFMQGLDEYGISYERVCVLRRAAVLLRHGGFRVSELTKLRASDLWDLYKKGRISLSNDTKTKKPRDVIFLEEDIAEIKEVFSCITFEDENEVLFPGRGGKYDKRNPQAFVYEINNAIHTLVGEQYSTHSFRAGYITDMFASGADAELIRQIMAHEAITTTLKYRYVSEDDKMEALRKARRSVA